ncbi:MAG: hydroxyacid dehydrogenase [Thermoprotei archaeon]
MVKILVTDQVYESGLKLLRENGFDVDVLLGIDESSLAKIIGNYDGLIVRGRTKVTKKVLENSGKLRIIVRAGVGLDNIDLNTAKERGISVFNTPAAPSVAAAELTIGLIICILRGIGKGYYDLRNGKWSKSELMGHEVRGKVVSIIGFGRIGYEVAKRLKAFDAKVVVYDVDRSRETFAKSLGVDFANSLEEALSVGDIVTLHVPLLPETRHLINANTIKIMKRGAYLINAARGEVVDEKALLEALKNGQLSGAALDVFSVEPPKEPVELELLSLPNIIATPHIGAQTIETQEAESVEAARIIINFFKK